ncbi:MAG TPA: hypothetical protein VGF86_05270 [Candidatus Tumulicola sp.]|jgi:hypothetical protein
MQFSSRLLRLVAIGAVIAASSVQAAGAQGVADKIAVGAANKMAAKISGESCADFAATMAKMKGGGAHASPSPMAARLKGNAQARAQFVNIVAGPLLNKMIDCDMLPGGS